MSEYVSIRVIFIPSGSLRDVAIGLAKEISEAGKTYFIVDDKKYYSHLTVYKTEFPEHSVNDVYSVVGQLAKDIKQLNLRFKRFYCDWGWVGFDFHKSKEIFTAHKKIVKSLNVLREGHISEKYLKEMEVTSKYSERQRKYIKNFGYPQVMVEYHPHLTLARFEDEDVGNKVSTKYNRLKIAIPDSKVSEIALAESGDHGTVTGILKRYKLVK